MQFNIFKFLSFVTIAAVTSNAAAVVERDVCVFPFPENP